MALVTWSKQTTKFETCSNTLRIKLLGLHYKNLLHLRWTEFDFGFPTMRGM